MFPERALRDMGNGRRSHRYVRYMPAMNVPFDDAEMSSLRAAAQAADQSLKDFIHDAALQRADRHKEHIAAAANLVAQRSAELNRRLRDK